VWAITSYFNAAGSGRRLANYRAFRSNLAVPLVAVELSFDGRFALTQGDADILIQISGGAMLWQKERLLNVALRSVPPDAKAVAWLDCDVIFERSDWMHESEQKLRDARIVQLYADLVDYGPDGYRPSTNGEAASGHGIVSLGLTRLTARTWDGVRGSLPGLAWAARKKILDAHGFYDAMIMGAGDTSMFHAMHGEFEHEARRHHLDGAHQAHFLKWARPYFKAVDGQVASIPGRIHHLWHGKVMHRGYGSRHRPLAALGFDPDADLVIGANGAWQWARPRPDLEDLLAGHFARRDDAVA
jgi:hypothetical protein